MHRAQNQQKGRKRSRSLSNGVSHMSRRDKRRLYCKLQLWMWRKWREKCHLAMFRAKKRFSRGSGQNLSSKRRKNKRKGSAYHTLNAENSLTKTSTFLSSLGCDTGGSEDAIRKQNCLQKLNESDTLPEAVISSNCLQNRDKETNFAAGTDGQTIPRESLVQFCEIIDPLRHCHSAKPLLNTDSNTYKGIRPNRTIPAQRLEVDGQSQQTTVTPGQDYERVCNKKSISPEVDVSLNALTKDIHEFLEDFYRKYGSFIPLHKSDLLRHLKGKFNTDFSDRKNIIFSEVIRYRAVILQKPVLRFQVLYKKHTLTLDDLLTLADQNWLNDQVMNMYGELIMESSHHKVHFLNSFFHRQLMTKGYDGVKRWTKQVDLFSKSLLLVPIHLEVHWCLVIADIVNKKICLYDSQGNALQKVARNILKYLMSEAKEKKQTAFESGWTVAFDEEIPQQTNENDCGVFVLEYSRCLALTRPLHFSQKDIPKIRKRIYKELCDCKLHEQD